jgi:hypothetical protein
MRKHLWRLVSFVLCAFVLNASTASAQLLGSAQTFAVLGASTVTNTGPSLVTGDLGVSPGTAITGFPPGVVVDGTVHAGDLIAAQAQADAHVAYAALKAMECPPSNNLTGQVLGTSPSMLPTGVYCFDTSAQLTGSLLLTGAGPWVFQIGSTLTTASNASVVVDNPANCGANVFWQVGSSATLGTGTQFTGNILALASATLTTSTNVSGSVVALTAAVTMDTNQLSVCGSGSGFPPPVNKCEKPHHHDRDHRFDWDDRHPRFDWKWRDWNRHDWNRHDDDDDDGKGHKKGNEGHKDNDDRRNDKKESNSRDSGRRK